MRAIPFGCRGVQNCGEVLWYNLSLIVLIASLGIVLVFAYFPRIWARVGFLSILGFKMGGVLMATWLVVTYAERTSTGFLSGASAQTLNASALASTILTAAERSLAVMLAGTVVGTAIGLGAAYITVSQKRRSLVAVGFAAAVIWVFPTFLTAVLVQELQAQLFNITGFAVGGSYGSVDPAQAFWAALVLSIRPAAYVYRRARLTLQDAQGEDHVRTAKAKGLPWRQVVNRHIVRPAAPSLTAGWIASFRLMIGSLPLVEFFFAYPGLGMQLVLAIGIAYPDQAGHFQPDLAIGLVAAMAAILLTLEALAKLLQQWLDPRLNELRISPA